MMCMHAVYMYWTDEQQTWIRLADRTKFNGLDGWRLVEAIIACVAGKPTEFIRHSPSPKPTTKKSSKESYSSISNSSTRNDTHARREWALAFALSRLKIKNINVVK